MSRSTEATSVRMARRSGLAWLRRKPALGIILSVIAGILTVLQAPTVPWSEVFVPPVEPTTLDRVRIFVGAAGVVFLAAGLLAALRPRFHEVAGAIVLILSSISLFFSGGVGIGPLTGILGGLFTFMWDVPVTAEVKGSLTCVNCGRTVTGSPPECPFCGYPRAPSRRLAWRFSYRRGGQA